MTEFENYGILANDMYRVHNLAADSLNEWKTISSVHKSGKGTKIRHIQRIRYILAELSNMIEQDRAMVTEAFACELQSLVDTIKVVLDDNYSKLVWQKDYITLQKTDAIASVSFPVFRDHPIPIYGALFRNIANSSYLCFQSPGFEIMMEVGEIESCFTLDGYAIQIKPEMTEEESLRVISGLTQSNPTDYGYESDQNGNFSIGIGEDMAIVTKHFNGDVSFITLDNGISFRISQASYLDVDECTGLVLALEENPDLLIYIPCQEAAQ